MKRIIEYLSVSSNLIVSYKELTEYIHLPIINPLKGQITPNIIDDIRPKKKSNLNNHKSFKIVQKVI